MAVPCGDKLLDAIVPVSSLRSSMFDTPPATPLDKRTSSVASCTPKTPRKVLPPVRTTTRTDSGGRSALLSFRVSSASTPTLKISCAFNNTEGWRRNRPCKARRTLFFDDIEEKISQSQQSKQRRTARSKKLSCHNFANLAKNPLPLMSLDKETSYEFVDADDEMDQIDLLSPPATPLPKLTSNEETPLPIKMTACRIGTKKTCLSCHTTKTPLWRDSEDGTPYCNACGIRYRKYRIRCPSCYCVPHKDELLAAACNVCGLNYSSTAKHRGYSR